MYETTVTYILLLLATLEQLTLALTVGPTSSDVTSAVTLTTSMMYRETYGPYACCNLFRSSLPLCRRCCAAGEFVTMTWDKGYRFTCKARGPTSCAPAGSILVNSSAPNYRPVLEERACCPGSVLVYRLDQRVRFLGDYFFHHVSIGCT